MDRLYLSTQTLHVANFLYSLRSEDQKFEFRCTHPRTNWDHYNAFPWIARRHISKVARMKVGRNEPNQRFSKSYVFTMEKNGPKFDVFQCIWYKEQGKNFAHFFGWQPLIWLSGGFTEMHCGGFELLWHGCNQLEFYMF